MRSIKRGAKLTAIKVKARKLVERDVLSHLGDVALTSSAQSFQALEMSNGYFLQDNRDEVFQEIPEGICAMAIEGRKEKGERRIKQMNLKRRLQDKREGILALAAKYGAYNVRIFGSVARGESDDDSDVDFLVAMESGRSLLDLGGLLMELQDLLDCQVDIVTQKELRPRIRDHVLAEAIVL